MYNCIVSKSNELQHKAVFESKKLECKHYLKASKKTLSKTEIRGYKRKVKKVSGKASC